MLLKLGTERPLYRAVTTALREAILAGRLKAGSRLPGTRVLARELGVSRIVTLAAFEQLSAEGYIVSTPGAGSRVAQALLGSRGRPRVARSRPPQLTAFATRASALLPPAVRAPSTSAPGAIDFRYASFPPELPTSRAWASAIGRAARSSDGAEADAAGEERLRIAVCAHVRRQRGIEAQPDDVLIVTGSQQALDLAARALCQDGALVGIEDPHYVGARQTFLAAGARLVPCAVGAGGLDVGRHTQRLAGAVALYVTPSHQFPTGAVMSLEHRLEVLAWARARNAWIVEDDYDSEFHYGTGTVPALRGLDGAERVIYVGTFARTLSPELRLGYAIVPKALRRPLRGMKWLADRGSSPLEQRAVAGLMESGAYERAQRRMARSLGERRRHAVAALRTSFDESELHISGSAAHLFLVFPHLKPDAVEPLLARAARRGVRLYGAGVNYLLPPTCGALLCGFANLNLADIERGIALFAAAYAARA